MPMKYRLPKKYDENPHLSLELQIARQKYLHRCWCPCPSGHLDMFDFDKFGGV